MLRLGRIFFELFAQPPDMHVHRADFAADIVAPDRVEQRLARIYAVGIAHQKLHEVEFLRRQIDRHAVAQRDAPLAPMIYATTEPQTLQRIQAQYGDKASSERVEQLFAALAAALKAKGFTRFIVAGGETSSIVAQTLGVEAFHIGPTISPGVPWVRDTRQPLSLALKSGNFGDIQFFARAQQEFRHD